MSKKTIVGVIAMCSLLLPVAAVAADGAAPAPSTIANQICKQEQVTLGANFKSTYGTNANKSNAFGKCVSKNAKNAQADVANAAKACDTERTADPAAFASKYGKNAKDKNAFGKVRVGEGIGVCQRTCCRGDVGLEAVQGCGQGRCGRLRRKVRHGQGRTREVRGCEVADEVTSRPQEDARGCARASSCNVDQASWSGLAA